ncbi:hypothetical protein DFH06DRAFT_1338703 [Mycena polygramma]|nr:hypothetical protein DFH06DRAFT_1338703 [Mycena polygramma]
MRAEKLSLAFPRDWLHSNLQQSLFFSVTHLELYQQAGEQSEQSVWHEWSRIASLPSLTHLCLSRKFHIHVLPRAVAECSRLSVAIAALWDEADDAEVNVVELARCLTVSDPRVVVMVIYDYKAEWETGARGGADFWARAEEFTIRKRRGEIEGSCYLLEE